MAIGFKDTLRKINFLYPQIFLHKFKESFNVCYWEKNRSLLAELCEEYGSDKGAKSNQTGCYGALAHSYSDYYASLYDHCRGQVNNVFECGIGTNNPNLISNMTANGKPGASLRVWRDYFPNAKIFGADIDKEILFSEDRISTGYLDQTNPNSIKTYMNENGNVSFDLMIDDGLHKYSAAICLFENAIDCLGENGIYIVEDVYFFEMPKFLRYFRNTDYRVEFVVLKTSRRGKNSDNNLIVIRKSSQK